MYAWVGTNSKIRDAASKMLKLFRGALMGARRDPMTSKRGNKAFYKG